MDNIRGYIRALEDIRIYDGSYPWGALFKLKLRVSEDLFFLSFHSLVHPCSLFPKSTLIRHRKHACDISVPSLVTISILIPVNILILTLKMLHLAVKLVPPLKGSSTASMQPIEYLQSGPVQEALKKTIIVDFNPNELLLDPTPQEDHTTIEKYHKDVSDKLGSDRKELQVLLPFGRQWQDMHTRLNVSNIN